MVGVGWMDTKPLIATRYSRSQISGGGPYTRTAPVSGSGANGGYCTDNKTVVLLPTFAAHQDESSTVGKWGRDETMGRDIVSVRQILDLLVDNGRVLSAASSPNSRQWGATLGGGRYIWRSGLGATADGALVYVGGQGLDIIDLAAILQRAGAVRAMELEINTDWANFRGYPPLTPPGAAAPRDGTELLSGMTGTPGRCFEAWSARDFITMSTRVGP